MGGKDVSHKGMVWVGCPVEPVEENSNASTQNILNDAKFQQVKFDGVLFQCRGVKEMSQRLIGYCSQQAISLRQKKAPPWRRCFVEPGAKTYSQPISFP